ncbi:MAG: glycosyltransferase family 4 protein [Lachnospiraceae bacterium]|nr:glycosyltransferase family 4 protein [Lachnospiraceae bacterium]
MRVLYMSHRYHTNQNTIMKGWVENGHEVCFLSQYAGKIEDYTYVRPIIVGYSAFFRFIDYIYVHILFRKNPYAIDMKLKCGIPPLRKLRKLIQDFKPDVAILRERSIYTICMTAICRRLHIPTILYILSPVWDKPKKMDLAHKIVWKLVPEYRMTPSMLVGADYSGLVKDEKAFFAPFLMEPRVSPERKNYFKNDRINIFSIGKYLEQKNHFMMIKAVEGLLDQYPLHLTIAGEVSNDFHREHFRSLEEYIREHRLEEHITLLQNLNKEQVFAQYEQADLYVLPGTHEAASVTMIEAMAFSVPAISGTDNGTASYIEEGINGYVFEDCSLEDLKKKLELAVCDKENIPRMGKAGYEHVLAHFQFANYYSVVEEILRLSAETGSGEK